MKGHRGASDVQYILLNADSEKKHQPGRATDEDSNPVEEFFAKYQAESCADFTENVPQACLGKLIGELVNVKVW